MDELQRVTFRFAGHIETQYLSRLPEVGDRVSHDRELWEVTGVESDPVGALVVCELPHSDAGSSFGEERGMGVR